MQLQRKQLHQTLNYTMKTIQRATERLLQDQDSLKQLSEIRTLERKRPNYQHNKKRGVTKEKYKLHLSLTILCA